MPKTGMVDWTVFLHPFFLGGTVARYIGDLALIETYIYSIIYIHIFVSFMLLCTNLFRACDMPCFTTEKQPLGAVRRCRCCWMGGRTGGLGDEMLDKFMDYFKQLVTGWWFEIFLCSSLFGEMIQFDSYF